MIGISAVSAAAIAVAAIFLYGAASLPSAAAKMPIGLAVILIALAVAMAVQAWWSRDPADDLSLPRNPGRTAGFVLAILAYVVLLQPLGYFIATPLFLVGVLVFLRTLSPAKSVALAAVTSGVVWGIFVWFLSLPVPMGLLVQD